MNNSPSHSFHLFSPLLQQGNSPFISPFPHLRKISDDIGDLISFKLEQEPNYLNFPECQPLSPNQSNNILQKGLPIDCSKLPAKEEIGQVISPHSQRCDMPSTRFHQPKEQQQPPFLLLSSQEPRPTIKNMIELLVQHSQLNEDLLFLQAKRFQEVGIKSGEAFKVLLGKFRKLKKTKQELTKYCMRKAFKYVSDLGKKGRIGRGLEDSMRRYFAEQDGAQSFCVPFKKNSTEKTMNGNFLKKVFSCSRFATDYHSFLGQFESLIKEDNQRKIVYLASLVEQAINENNMGKIEGIRRLPWTQQILEQTRELAASLPEEGNGRRIKRNQ